MTASRPDHDGTALDAVVARARTGDRDALEDVVRAVQPDVHGLALRFLWHPEDAEDATQEILVRIVTNLGTFRAESSFRTWVYRVACNALLSIRNSRAEARAMSLDQFAADLDTGLSDPGRDTPDVEHALLLEEIRIGCTTAMLLGLDRAHRLAYVLGEILELDHNEAGAVLEISAAAYRKRLSRARAAVTRLMQAKCGLFDRSNACRCRLRTESAVRRGRVDPSNLLFARSAEQARRFPAVLHEIRRLDEARRAAALHRANRLPESRADFTRTIRDLLE